MKLTSKLALAAAFCVAIMACQKQNEEPPPPPQGKTQQTPQGQDQAKNQEQGTGAPSKQAEKDQEEMSRLPPNVPQPTDRGADARVISAVLNPSDQLTALLANYLAEKSPAVVPKISSQIVDEIFSEDDLVRPKIFEIQQSVAKVSRAGVYSQEAANRIALLQARLQLRVKDEARDDVLRDGMFIVGSSAVIGALAGTRAYENIPYALPALRRGMKDLAVGTRDRFASMYARSKDAVRGTGSAIRRTGGAIGSATTGAVRGVGNATRDLGKGIMNVTARARLPSAGVAYRNLESFELTSEELASLQGLERVPSEIASGFPFKDTDMAGFRYAVVDQWLNQDLGSSRRLLFEVKRMLPGSSPRFVLSNDLDSDMARAIERKLAVTPEAQAGTKAVTAEGAAEETMASEGGIAEAGKWTSDATEVAPATTATAAAAEPRPSRVRRFVYFFDPRTWSFTPVRMTYTAFKDKMASAGQGIKPLFAKVDWPTATGTAVASGVVTGVAYYGAHSQGFENGERYDAMDLEKMVPADRANRAEKENKDKSPAPKDLGDPSKLHF